MLRQALILAAGRGRPVGDPEIPNCLSVIGGMTLMHRTLRVLRKAGVRRVGVTVGFRSDLLRQHIDDLRRKDADIPGEIAFFENPDWQGPNGLSVLSARTFLTEPTLLLMADQIATPGLVGRFAHFKPKGDLSTIAVDRALGRVFDIDDATKVQIEEGQSGVLAISKTLKKYQAVSVGIFVMAPSLVDVMAGMSAPSLTEGVAEAARQGLVEAIDVDEALWQDVDSAQMRLHAEWLLRAYGDDLEIPAVRGDAPGSAATDALALIERLLGEKDAPRYTLLNPGPVMTSARVKAALVHHDVCHRDEDYTGVVRRLTDKLRPLFGGSPAHEILLVTGSGTAAMEAAIASVVPAGRTILTIENGAFGERLGDIAAVHGLGPHRFRLPWGQIPEPAAVESFLDAHPDVAALAVIHHETSVGVLNPVAALGRMCQARGVLLLVDAVSSLGAEDLDVVRDGVDLCFSSANKCLHGVAGAAFLCVAPGVWDRVAQVAPRGYYLDLRRYRRAMQDLGQTPFTPAVSTFFALETALDELAEQGGTVARRDTYRRRRLRIRRVLTDLGFQSFTNTGRESSSISTMRVPSFLDPSGLYDQMKERGFVIYKAKGILASDHIQVANMGELSDADIDSFLQALTAVVQLARTRLTENVVRLKSV